MEEKQIFSSEFYKKLDEYSELQKKDPENMGVELDESLFDKSALKELCRSKLRTIRVAPKP